MSPTHSTASVSTTTSYGVFRACSVKHRHLSAPPSIRSDPDQGTLQVTAELPTEILTDITHFLAVTDIPSFALVCRRWSDIAKGIKLIQLPLRDHVRYHRISVEPYYCELAVQADIPSICIKDIQQAQIRYLLSLPTYSVKALDLRGFAFLELPTELRNFFCRVAPSLGVLRVSCRRCPWKRCLCGPYYEGIPDVAALQILQALESASARGKLQSCVIPSLDMDTRKSDLSWLRNIETMQCQIFQTSKMDRATFHGLRKLDTQYFFLEQEATFPDLEYLLWHCQSRITLHPFMFPKLKCLVIGDGMCPNISLGFEDMALVADALPELTRLQIGNLRTDYMGRFATFIPALRKLQILVLDRIGSSYDGYDTTTPFILVSNARSKEEALGDSRHLTSGSTSVPMLVRSTSLKKLYLRFRKPGAFYIAHSSLTKLVVSGCCSTRELVTKDELTHWPNTDQNAVQTAVKPTLKDYFISSSLQSSLSAYLGSTVASLISAPLNYVTSNGRKVGSLDLGMHPDVLNRLQHGLLDVTIVTAHRFKDQCAHIGKDIVVKTDWEQNEDYISLQQPF